MKKSILALAITAISTSVFAAEMKVAGDDLSFFNGQREAVQIEANVLDVTGKTWIEIGEILGERLKGISVPEVPAYAYNFAKIVYENNRKLAPEYMDMLEAQAKVRGISIMDLLAVTIHFDIGLDSSITGQDPEEYIDRGCTTMAFNNGIVGQTLDLPIKELRPDSLILKHDTFIASMEDGGLHQGMGRNVGVTINFLGKTSDPTPVKVEKMVTTDVFAHALKMAKNVEDVIEIAEKWRTPIAYNMTVADKNGGYAAVANTGSGVTVKRGTSRGVAHTNHLKPVEKSFNIRASDKNYLEANKKFKWTFARKDAAELFIKYTPELTVEAMQYAFSQRPINLTQYNGDDFVTVFAYVFDLPNGCAYISPENPRFSGQYTQICFDN